MKTLIAEYKISGTYPVTIEKAGFYNLEMVGAGGGGAHAAYEKYWRAGTGGSGAGFKGEVYLTAGTYTVTVGAGGSEDYYYQANSSRATDGGSTTLSINSTSLITCGGGTGGSVVLATITTGSGGTLSVGGSVITRNVELNANGNNGNSSSRYGSYIATDGGLSVYTNTTTGYGAGGSTITEQAASPDAVSGYFKMYRIDPTNKIRNLNATKRIIRKYYKYVETHWNQPVLSENGTLGVSDYAVAANAMYSGSPYGVFNGGGATAYLYIDQSSYLIFYSKTPICLKSWSYKGVATNNYSYSVTAGKIFVSNDGQTWLLLKDFSFPYEQIWNPSMTATIDLSSNSSYFNYYKFVATAKGSNPDNWALCSYATLGAVKKVVEESTAEDYDFYEDIEVYEAAKLGLSGLYHKTYEFSTAGLHNVYIPESATCEVTLVGGGGGGTYSRYSSSVGTWTASSTGGSAGMIQGTTNSIAEGTYEVVVGAAGGYAECQVGYPTQPWYVYGGNGGDTTAFGNVAKGGSGGFSYTGAGDPRATHGSGGSFILNSEGLTGSDGSTGSTTSRYDVYGGGGNVNKGQGGYAKVVISSPVEFPDYDYYTSHDKYYSVKL